ncbi:class I SAM-dependent methyltransferase [Halorussus caseinilyticus]|uniref:Class I SAM-dependent methyltransferase n=1 Tax=Halorussus caseinilyticus TaxID=3034025 RepID=A0ABD5WQ45_9EURY|nr:class I SAM-dependent methyltransferase [Halorussus sp. DT72]
MNFQRYLSAKRTVDERALNPRVEDRLAAELDGRDARDDPLRVLEVGAGIGASVVRLLGRSWLPNRVTYTALDVKRENVACARERLPTRASALGYAVGRASDERARASAAADANDQHASADGRFVCSRGRRRVEVEFRTADAFDYLAATDEAVDLLVAHAFVDLVDPDRALSVFRDALAPDGLAYCPITFDRGTIFQPVADPEFEARLTEAFHRHLDRTGDSRAGRRLLSAAVGGREQSGGRDGDGGSGSDGDTDAGDGGASGSGGLLAAGGSDWVVHPRDGDYPADEGYFLQCIVEMVESAVRAESAIDDDRLSAWVARRRDQIDRGELVYVAHQLDVLAR